MRMNPTLLQIGEVFAATGMVAAICWPIRWGVARSGAKQRYVGWFVYATILVCDLGWRIIYLWMSGTTRSQLYSHECFGFPIGIVVGNIIGHGMWVWRLPVESAKEGDASQE